MIGFTAPHGAASKVGLDILEQGGTAVEAMVAAAASIAVVYPHMNGLGGDGFWLISEPGKAPIAIDACGVSAQNATLARYEGEPHIPFRGPNAALTMAGAVAGWQKALNLTRHWQSQMPLNDLLGSAIQQASSGIEVTQSLQDASEKTWNDLSSFEGFSAFKIDGKGLSKGQTLTLPILAKTLSYLAEQGLDDFYHGDIGHTIAKDLTDVGSPLRHQDFLDYQAQQVAPLTVKLSKGQIYNLPAPTQGLASLMILGLFDRLVKPSNSMVDNIHLLIECTKQAFIVRDSMITDPSRMKADQSALLSEASLDAKANNISMQQALAWPHQAQLGDTIWMGACDNQGRMVSYIQSLYWEFGSGIVSPNTGIVWNNRGTAFSLDKDHNQALGPGLKPLHTLNPAYADLADGRRMVYGTMGGEGQPQTQGAIFTRHVYDQLEPAEAVAKGRWLLGRTWGEESHNLKIESDLAHDVADDLAARGHEVCQVPACNEMMGHAGMVVLEPNGSVKAATDPRSDGQAFAQ